MKILYFKIIFIFFYFFDFISFASQNSDMTEESKYKIFDILINKSTKNDLYRILGNSKIYKEDEQDFEHSPEVICYYGKDRSILKFYFGFFNDFKTLSGYDFYQLKLNENAKKCTYSNKINLKISPFHRLKLGINKNYVIKVLGKPYKTNNSDELDYKFENNIKYKKPILIFENLETPFPKFKLEGLIKTTDIIVKFQKGMVNFISIYFYVEEY